MGYKKIIFPMIEEGKNNSEIMEATGVCRVTVVYLRTQYNRAVPLEQRKHSRRKIPLEGSQHRIAYDFIIANPDSTCTDFINATGLKRTIWNHVMKRYLSHINTSKHKTLISVTLADLKLSNPVKK